jgi:hypothetical protein
MQQQYTEIQQNTPVSFVINYHKHPEIGGTGHISMIGVKGSETVELSIYPKPSSFQLPLAVGSFYIFPSNATNYSIKTDQEGHSPIAESYTIPPESIPNPHQAFEQLKQIRKSVESGHTGFSLTRNFLTEAIFKLTSPKVSATNIHIGYKMLNREAINGETKNANVTNCAESATQVLQAGGIPIPKSACTFSNPTPSGISDFLRKQGFHKTHSGNTFNNHSNTSEVTFTPPTNSRNKT